MLQRWALKHEFNGRAQSSCGSWKSKGYTVHFFMRHLTLRLFFLILLFSSASGYAAELRVGVYSNEPKIFIDDKQHVSGILVDVLREIAAQENWQLRFKACEWEECLRLLHQGQIDLLPDVAYTDERNKNHKKQHKPKKQSKTQ